MTVHSLTRRAVTAAAVVLSSTLALAAGGGGGGGGGGAGGGSDEFSVAPDPDYKAGEAAIRSKDWREALARMNRVVERNPANADAWNYLGYAYRQIGDMDNSLRHYERALALDPRHRNAREYLGEAYLQVGKLAEAEAQLRALDKLCLLPCEQYSDLKEKIERYRQMHGKRS